MANTDNVSTNRAGELAVIDALLRRGVSEVEVERGRPRWLRFRHHGRLYQLHVKARRSGTWQTSTTEGKPRNAEAQPTRFWVFVDLAEQPARFYVAPDWWVQNDIHDAHQKYLARHGGHRAETEDSTHHAIPLERVSEWRDAWVQLGLATRA